MGLIFLSYRRDDVGAFTHNLADALARSLGESQIFLDLDRVRVGTEWHKRIDDALSRATLLIPIIGPRWLLLQDMHGRRRLDQANDWVRKEIESALQRRLPVLPMLVDGASAPLPEALPPGLEKLTNFQAYSFSSQYFKRDFPDFLKHLREYGFSSVNESDIFPAPLDKSPRLGVEELGEAMKTLPNWQIVDTRPLPDGSGAKVELFRHFVFGSFPDVVHFMTTASRYVHRTDHHPEWLNLWINLKVWLTTWDIGFKPTYKDIRLALYLESLFKDYNRGDEHSQETDVVLPKDIKISRKATDERPRQA